MEGLGRVLNIVPTADGVEIDMTDCQAVTFVCVGADTYTIQEAEDGTGTNVQDLLAWDRWHTNSGAVGATQWVLATDDTPAAALVVAAGNVAITVNATELSDGFTHVQCNSAAGGLVYAITHDLVVQRAPENLPALTG